jgi:hypothetical protein
MASYNAARLTFMPVFRPDEEPRLRELLDALDARVAHETGLAVQVVRLGVDLGGGTRGNDSGDFEPRCDLFSDLSPLDE